MEPERWQEIERLFYSALNEEKSMRAAFLERACNGDEAALPARIVTVNSGMEVSQ